MKIQPLAELLILNIFLILFLLLCLQDKIGVVLVKTGSLIVVGTYNDNMYPSVCIEAVEKLGKLYLRELMSLQYVLIYALALDLLYIGTNQQPSRRPPSSYICLQG